ncbi:MAG: hypothetical protein Q9216_001385 [Gyalolechia sp. 2 TL-2023]
MAKEKPSAESEEKRLKKEKKEKKRSETEGVHKSSSKKKDKSEKRDKKDHKDKKKDKKDRISSNTEVDEAAPPPANVSAEHSVTAAAAEDVQMTTELLNSLEKENPGSVMVKGDGGDVEVKVKRVEKPLLIGALVPFAHPLADEKVGRKVLKGVKRAAKNKTLKRGVKEVVKSLRKSPTSTITTSSSSASSLPSAVVILAADISPMDVISHLPVLCEDHGIPYVFVTSRVELGAASSTKRPTSVVMVARDKGGKGAKEKEKEKEKEGKEKEGDEGEAWEEVYADLVKVVVKAGKGVRV